MKAMHTRSILGIVVVVLGFWIGSSALEAATIDVTTTMDELNTDGDCSLREAITSANTDTAIDACTAGSGADVINLASGTYTLSIPGTGEDNAVTGDLDITGSDLLSIVGAGADTTIIDGGELDRVLDVFLPGGAVISGVTIRNGNASGDVSGDIGGGIRTYAPITIQGCRIIQNTASDDGGGVFNSYSVDISDSTVSENMANGTLSNGDGGGIKNKGILDIVNSTISNNHARRGGGGIWNDSGGTLVMENSTVSGNTAVVGGGLRNENASANLLNVTIADNNSEGISHFSFTGLLHVSMRNTIVANNVGANCTGHPVTSLGHNLDSGNACGLAGAGDITNADPRLGPLRDNGGDTFTHALLAGSPAINNGDNAACPANDQRGVARPQGPSCDIGAYEFKLQNFGWLFLFLLDE